MKLIELFESTPTGHDLRLGVINGFKFIFPGGSTKLPPQITAYNLSVVCKNFADRLKLIIDRGVEIQAFRINLQHYNIVLFCNYNIKTRTVFINGVEDPNILVTDTNLSVMEMTGLYELFDTQDTLNYNDYKIKDDNNLHGADRIREHGLQKHVNREQIEQMMKEAADKIKYVKSLGFYVRFAQVYSESVQQGLICKVRQRDNLIVIKTYLPHASNRVKSNAVLIHVS